MGQFRRAPKPWDEVWFPGKLLKERKILAKEHVSHTTQSFVEKVVGEVISHGEASPISAEEFLSHYGGAKLKCYQAAVESLKEQPLNDRDCMVKTFTKDEYRKPGGAPRAIQPRSPRFNVILGRYIKHVEHKVFEAIDKVYDATGSHRTVAKGMNMAERGKTIAQMWGSFSDPVAIGLDASRFDQHINRMLLEVEHSIYLQVCGTDPRLPNLDSILKAQRVNKGVYKGPDGKIAYTVEGNRMSGDMNTSLGNVIIMCCLMHSYLTSKGLTDCAKLLNDGDDCVLIMDRRNVDKFKEGMEDWFGRMGINMQYDGVYDMLEKVEFCQSRPVNINGTYCLVPRPSKRLYSDLFTTKNITSRKVYHKMLGAKGDCGLAMSSGVPIFQSFYSWFCRSAKPWRPEEGSYYWHYRQQLADGMESRRSPVSWETRISFYHAFNITPQEQVLLEKYYDTRERLVYSRPLLKYHVGVDPMQTIAPPEQADGDLPVVYHA